jgi:hypothetical protein
MTLQKAGSNRADDNRKSTVVQDEHDSYASGITEEVNPYIFITLCTYCGCAVSSMLEVLKYAV